ncbi:hypothetical protein D9M72_227860 [compost metagenome]
MIAAVRRRERAEQAAALHHHGEEKALGDGVALRHQDGRHQREHRDLRAVCHGHRNPQRDRAPSQAALEDVAQAHPGARRFVLDRCLDIGRWLAVELAQAAGCEHRQHPVGLVHAPLGQQEARRLRNKAPVEHDEECRQHQAGKQPAPAVRTREHGEDRQAEGRRQHIAQAAAAHADQAHRGTAEARRAQLGQHGHGDRDLPAQADADDKAARRQHPIVRRQRADDGAEREQQQVGAQHRAPAVAVRDIAGADASQRGGTEGQRIEKADLRHRDAPLLAQHGTDQADGVLLEDIEHHPEHDHEDDLLVRRRHPDAIHGPVELMLLWGIRRLNYSFCAHLCLLLVSRLPRCVRDLVAAAIGWRL